MFKYLKNMYGASGTPEVIDIPVRDYDDIPVGTLAGFYEYGIDYANGGKKGRTFVTVEEKIRNDGKTSIKAMKALPGMLFEVQLINVNEIEEIAVGSLVASNTDSSSHHIYVCPEGGDFIEVISTAEYEKTGKIIVTFI